MTSTRDKNSTGNYCLEQKSLKQIRNNLAFYNSPNGHAYDPAFPELYMPSHMPSDILSNNPTDIESSLFGIGTNNLVNPNPEVVPSLRNLPTVSFFSRQPIILPKTIYSDNNQRPIIV